MTQPTPQPDAQQTQAQPSTDTAPIEKPGYASELLAYRVIDNLGDIIARQVRKTLGNKRARLLLVSDPEQALGGMPLGEIRGQIRLLQGVFEERENKNTQLLESLAEKPAADLTGAEIAPIITAIAGFTGTLTDIAALFRSNYKTVERDFDVKDPAVLSSVAGSLVQEGFTVLIPGLYSSKESEILSALTNLSKQAADLQTQGDALASRLPKPVDKTEPGAKEEAGKPAPTLPPERVAEIAAAVRDTDAILSSFKGFSTLWTTPPQGQTQTKLEKALIRERIDELDITHFLWLSNLSSGGDTTTRESLFQGNRIGFMGGAAVSFVLADASGAEEDGEILDGNTYAQYGVTGGELRDYMGRSMTVRYTPVYGEPQG